MNRHVSIGILGGGQLARMLAQAAYKLPFKVDVSVYDASDTECARSACDTFTCGPFDDAPAIKRFAQNLDLVTYEFEQFPFTVVQDLPNAVQGSRALEVLQNRILEKAWINRYAMVPCVPYEVVSEAYTFTYPIIVKTPTSGYDGKGQQIIRNAQDLKPEHFGMVAEQMLIDPIEYSMIIARNIDGTCTRYPALCNVHVNHILDTTEFASVSEELELRMYETARVLAESLEYVGVLAVEFFFSDGNLYVNEVAPRVHNSGHITLDAANVSQFDLHLYSLLGLPFPTIKVDTSWCMVNVLGQHYEAIRSHTCAATFYDYGKHSTAYGRKVGHINGKLADIELLKEARTS